MRSGTSVCRSRPQMTDRPLERGQRRRQTLRCRGESGVSGSRMEGKGIQLCKMSPSLSRTSLPISSSVRTARSLSAINTCSMPRAWALNSPDSYLDNARYQSRADRQCPCDGLAARYVLAACNRDVYPSCRHENEWSSVESCTWLMLLCLGHLSARCMHAVEAVSLKYTVYVERPC